MNKLVLRSKIDEAQEQLTLAEEEFATAVRELRGAQRAEKTVTTKLIESALDKLKVSKVKVSELKRLLDAEDDE